jgi:predicted nucleic acid-binding protein
LTIYLDASVLVSLLADDVNTAAARRVAQFHDPVVVSAWTLAECSSAFARLRRMGRLTDDERDALESDLDAWGPSRMIAMTTQDFELARSLVRVSRTGLRAADALHLAVASRESLRLATFDEVLTQAAVQFGVSLLELG